jgi:hypothetical protein
MHVLKENWNPIFEADKIDKFILPYPYYSELSSAVSYSFFNNNEIGKHINIIFAFSSFFLIISLLSKRYTTLLKSILIAFLISFNPIVICQLFTYYVDGLLALSLSLLLFILLERLCIRRASLSNALSYLAIIVIICNIKFTGVIYGLIFVSCFILLDIKLNNFLLINHKIIVKKVVSCFGPFFLAIIIFGYYPYITNIVYHHNIFYPLMGKNSVDILSENMPYGENGNFVTANRIKKFFASYLAKPQNAVKDMPVDLSVNADMNIASFSIFCIPDVRINGFGTYFPIILMLFIFLILSNYKLIWKNKFFFLILSFFSLLSIFINPAAWWARYVPHVWILIFFFIPFLINANFYTKIISHLILAAAVLNILGCGYFNLGCNISGTEKREAFLSRLRHGVIYSADFGLFRGNEALLKSRGISYKEMPFVRCFNDILSIPDSQTVLSLQDIRDWFNTSLSKARIEDIKKYDINHTSVDLPCILIGNVTYHCKIKRKKEVILLVEVNPMPINCSSCYAELQPPYLYVPVYNDGKICMSRIKLGQEGRRFIILAQDDCWLQY